MKLVLGKTPEQLVRMLEQSLTRQQERWKPIVYPQANQESAEITPANRIETMRWLAQLNKKYYFAPETLSLASSVLDRFLTTVKCRPRYLRVIGVASFYLAAKTVEEDEVLPATLDLVHASECGCSVAEVLRMERVVLDKLRWDLNASTALEFVHILYALLLSQQPRLLDHLAGMTPSRQLSMLTDKLMHCVVNEYRLAAFPPAAVATALLSIELELFSTDWLPATIWLQTVSQCNQQDFLSCRELLTRSLATLPSTRSYAYSHQCGSVQRATKRRISQLEDSDDEDDNIYDGIKRLYNEEPETPAMVCVN